MGDPKNASISGDGFRWYKWVDAATGKETDVLSVTSIRTLCGEAINLVSWKMANLADAALGTMKRTTVGPRGGIKEKRQVWEYPSEFVRKYEETEGEQSKIDDLRRWLRDQADAPRNIAAIRGTIVHGAIENNVDWDRIEQQFVEDAFADLSSRDRKKLESGVGEEDVSFVRNAVRQYWAMRSEVPMMILAREVQVWNLTAGYAGTFDALVWVLGDFTQDDDGEWEFTPLDLDGVTLPKPNAVTLDDVELIGGTIVMFDWKTSADVHTDQVVQAVAYMSAEFVGTNGIKNERLTELLTAATVGALAHIRPNKWGLYVFEWEPQIARAFFGSVAFARFLARFRKPEELFIHSFTGVSIEEDDDG